MSKKNVTFTVRYGRPFRDFRSRNFYVDRSRIDPQGDDMNCDTSAQAEACALQFAKEVEGTVTKTTTETIAAPKGRHYGACNRRACRNEPAIYFNDSTKAYYCRPCANKINEVAGLKLCHKVD